MNISTLMELYKKERDYQTCCFGDYGDVNSLNFASFLLFIEEYLTKAKKGYSGKWDKQLPSWLINSKEMDEGSAPVRAYEELLKVFVLAGAALETYANIDADEWRKDPENEIRKWKERNKQKGE